MNRAMNAKSNIESAIATMDEAFDHMGGASGTYDSWPSRNIKGRVDLDYMVEGRKWLEWQKENNALTEKKSD